MVPCRVVFVSHGCLGKWPSAALSVVRERHWFCVCISRFGEFPFPVCMCIVFEFGVLRVDGMGVLLTSTFQDMV